MAARTVRRARRSTVELARVEKLIEATARAEGRHFWYRGFRRFVHLFLQQAAGDRTDLRVLDCGCGTGANLALLSRFGRAHGLDVTWGGLERARRTGHRGLIQASAANVPFRDGAFDLVTSFDVLYCLDDAAERRALREMYRLLRPDGAAVIHVPAMRLLRGNHSVFVHELRRYSRTGLAAAVSGAGFHVERITHTNATLFLPMLVRRLAQRLRGLRDADEARSDFVQPPEPLNALLAGILALESFVVRHVDLPMGSSILCLARKPAAA